MTVMTNVVLVLKDSQGNIGIVKQLTDNDIIKIANAITDVGQVVDPATHMPIEATTASVGVVQLATAQDITNGTAGKVVDAQELNNFAQTLPAANGVTDVSSGDNSNQLVVSRIGGSKTLIIDNVEHADNADEATHATQADTATSANSVAWDNVSGKPSSYTPSAHTHDDRYYTESEIDTKLSGKANSSHTHDDRYYTESEIDTKLSGKSDTTHNHNSAYLGITAKAESAKSADSVAWNNVSGKPSTYTPSSHTHDDRYYTESEIDTKLNGKANTNHTHNYAGSSSAGGKATSAEIADSAKLLEYSHNNEVNFKGGRQKYCFFNYRNADDDSTDTAVAVEYKFCNYGGNSVAGTTVSAETFKESGTSLADKYQAKGSYVSTSTIWVG